MDPTKNKSENTRTVALLGILVAFMGGYVLGRMGGGAGDGQALVKKAARAKRSVVPVGLSPAVGPADAPVTIVEFADFECPYCAKTVPTRKRLLEEFGGKVRWVFKHFPLKFHTRARGAAAAAMAAHAQGRFWKYGEKLFANKKRLGAADLERYAEQLQLDMGTFREAIKNSTYAKVVEADRELGKSLKVQGTPNYFINGRHFASTMPYADFARAVRQELAYTDKLLRDGVKRAELYRKMTEGGAAASVKRNEARRAVLKQAVKGGQK